MSALTASRGYVRRRRASSPPTWLWVTIGVLGLIFFAYLAYGLARPSGAYYAPIDGWTVDGFEFVVAGLCIAKGFRREANSTTAFALGAALLCWAAGDTVLTIESLGGATPPMPSLGDVFYLAFYPLAYVGIVIFVRRQINVLTPPNWLDGIAAGLGAASICAAFAFHSIVHSTHDGKLGTAVNLAYPIGDLLLLGVVVGGMAIVPGRRKTPWILLSVACLLNTVGDTFNLFQQASVGASRIGTLFDAVSWPGAFLLIVIAVWIGPPLLDHRAHQKPRGFALPGAAAVAALVILYFGTVGHLSRVALGLSAATLVVVGLRFALSLHALRLVTEERHVQSVTDELTGLGNRRHLSEVLESFFADIAGLGGSERSLAFLFLDLDRFKEVNDSFGHSAGDDLLRQLGPRLSAVLRQDDVLVRVGGDEFAIVLCDCDATYAAKVADRLAAAVEEPFVLGVVTASVTASTGVALAPAHASDAESLLRCADVAMYRAKTGSTRVQVYDKALDVDTNAMLVVEELRSAINERQLVLHYQPILDLRSGRVAGVEALVRWPHPRLGYLSPLKFLSLAEEAGLMPYLTEFVLCEALSQCRTWRAEGHEISVSVNVSATNLLDSGFTSLIRRELEHHHLPSDALVVEITETCIISDYDRSRRVVEELRDNGILTSIDDFGAGVTSLAHLSELAARELKLDQSLLFRLGPRAKKRDLDLVRSTIDLGHALSMRVVGEGVEDAALLRTLSELGCDLAQGYHICRPMPASDLKLAGPLQPAVSVAG